MRPSSTGDTTSTAAFLALVEGRRGHFQLESGHHGDLWLDLDALFAAPRAVAPFVASLAAVLRAHGVDAVCGPLLGGAFLAQLVAHDFDVGFCFTQRIVPEAATKLYGVRYVLPRAFEPRVRGKRVAIVDDVMSAGSALRGTYEELRGHGAEVVAAGALLVLGTAGESYFAERGIPVAAVARDDYQLWLPESCPRCAAGDPVERVS